MRLLKVQGKGQVSVEPDLVTLSFDVEAKAKDYGKCLNKLNAQADDLRKSMTASGLDKTRLKTSAFNVRVETEYTGGEHVFVGYRSSHRMQIEMPVKKALLNKVLRHVSEGNSGAEIRLSFSVKDKDTLHQKVLAQAVQQAKGNADTLASAAGVKLGKLIQMEYGWAELRIYDQHADMVCESAAGKAAYNADIQPQDVSAEDSVTLVYEIAE